MSLRFCEKCKKEFKCKPSENRRFCSRECWKLHGLCQRTYECTHCKETVILPPQSKKKMGIPFCSKKCFDLYEKGKNNPAWKGVREAFICKECKKEFIVKNTRRKHNAAYCSYICKAINYNRLGWPKEHNIIDSCYYCSKEINITKRKVGKRNFCTRECANHSHSNHMRGINNGRFVHGLSSSPYPVGWTTSYKNKIRDRDGEKCMLCSLTQEEHSGKLHVHHIDYDKNNLEMLNLITLCKFCHGKLHGNQESREYWKQKLLNLSEG